MLCFLEIRMIIVKYMNKNVGVYYRVINLPFPIPCILISLIQFLYFNPR